MSIDEDSVVSYIQNTLSNAELAYKMSARCNLPGADQLFVARFQQLFDTGNYSEAARVAATAPRVRKSIVLWLQSKIILASTIS